MELGKHLSHLSTATASTCTVTWLVALAFSASGCGGKFKFQTAEELAKDRFRSEAQFRCDPSQQASPTSAGRLSQIEYFNTIRDLISPIAFDPFSESDPLKVEIAAALRQVPQDEHTSGFARLDNRISQQHIDAAYYVADSLSNSIAGQEGRLRSLVNAVAANCYPTGSSLNTTTANGRSCVTAFIRGFGRRAFRRPLSIEETTKLNELATRLNTANTTEIRQELFRSIIFVMLSSPQFYYHLEINGQLTGNSLALTQFETASRLSYFIAETMPSDTLLDAAEGGRLGTEAQVRQAVADLMTTYREKMKTKFFNFVLNWMLLIDDKPFGNSPQTLAFLNSAPGGNVTYAEMLQEIRDLLDYHVWNSKGGINDLITTDVFVTESPALAAAYGVQPFRRGGTPVRLPASERSGLLTRAALLTTGAEETAPLHRGLLMRSRVLCTDLEKPDPTKFPAGTFSPPKALVGETERDALSAKTSRPECMSCHSQVNDIGFNLGNYDGIGRFTTEERRFSTSGALISRLSINSSGKPRITKSDPRTAENGVDLSNFIAESESAESCFIRQFFRYTYRKREQTGDYCELNRMKKLIQAKGTREAIQEFLTSAQFRTRVVGQ